MARELETILEPIREESTSSFREAQRFESLPTTAHPDIGSAIGMLGKRGPLRLTSYRYSLSKSGPRNAKSLKKSARAEKVKQGETNAKHKKGTFLIRFDIQFILAFTLLT
jgi:hypothetical protein